MKRASKEKTAGQNNVEEKQIRTDGKENEERKKNRRTKA